jgi:hypothetical protein
MNIIKIRFKDLQEFLRYVAATNLSPGGSGVPYMIILKSTTTSSKKGYFYDISSTGGDGIITVYHETDIGPGRYIWDVSKGEFAKDTRNTASVKANELLVFIQENTDSTFIDSIVT